jgi:hypothetical protein
VSGSRSSHGRGSTWFRWATRFGVVLLFLVAVFISFLTWSDSRLQHAIAQLNLDDPGWQFDDVTTARASIPDDENSARVVVAAAALLPEQWPPQDITDAFSNLPPTQRLERAEYARLCNELNEWDSALAEAQKLSGMPRGRHQITYKRPNLSATLLTDQQNARKVAVLLQFAALRRTEEGDYQRAMTDCQAIVNSGRSIGDEPFLISMLIRNACVAIGCKTANRVLAQGEAPPAASAALQHLLEDEDVVPDLLLGVRGERASLHEMFTAVEAGDLSLADATGSGHLTADGLVSSLLRPEFKTEHPQMLSLMTRYVEAAKLPLHEQAAVEAELEAEIRGMSKTAILTKQMLPAISNVSRASRRKHAWVHCTIVCLAAERYRQAHRKWPSTLAELIPAEMSAVPLDPYDGQPLRFLRLPDGVVIYSVGPDGNDDGGNVTDMSGLEKPGTDTGFRLWDPARRRQKPPEQ